MLRSDVLFSLRRTTEMLKNPMKKKVLVQHLALSLINIGDRSASLRAPLESWYLFENGNFFESVISSHTWREKVAYTVTLYRQNWVLTHQHNSLLPSAYQNCPHTELMFFIHNLRNDQATEKWRRKSSQRFSDRQGANQRFSLTGLWVSIMYTW